MKNDELKFMLKLLGCSHYRSPLSFFDNFKQRKNPICVELGDRNLIGYSKEISNIKLLPAGKALLKMSDDKLPLSKEELKVLESLGKVTGSITPSKLNLKGIKATERDEILINFAVKGFIEITEKIKRQKAEVWLTEEGLNYLRDEFIPSKGNNPVISLTLLGNYLTFLRKNSPVKTVPTTQIFDRKPTDSEILQTIIDLDHELGTENYLPIFHLRNKLQPPLTRDELDQALYRLESEDKLEISSIVEAVGYSNEQLQAGIPQNVGGRLFFLIVNE